METIELDGAKLFKFKLGPSTFLVNPTEGARLINWNISMADGLVRDVVYWPENSPVSGDGFTTTLGGMFVMFPFCGVSFADGKRDFWKTPDGRILPMKFHGYARDGDFAVDYVSDSELRLRFLPDSECKVSYDYDYEFSVRYRFSDLSMSCELVLDNRGDVKMPWGSGFHPFFKLPWTAGTSRKDYRFLCDAKKAFNILPDGSFVAASPLPNCFADPAVYNRLSQTMKTGLVKFGPKNGEEDITIKIDGGGRPEPATTLVTWSKSDDEPYYCVEPWMSLPNSASNPKHYVAPKSVKSFAIEISLI